MDRNKLIGLAIAGGALWAYTSRANAGVTSYGGFVDPGSLPQYDGEAALALQNLLATLTAQTHQPIPDYTAVIPGPADYDDALPGSDFWGSWDWGASTDTPWDYDDAEQFPADYWATNWGVYDEYNGSWDEGGGRIIPIGGFLNGEKNLQAILKAIRWAEGTSDEYGYQALYGYRPGNGKIFTDFSDHPRISFKTPWGTTSAAGAYQMQAGTWDDAVNKLGLTGGFTPANQDSAAAWLIDRRGALQDVLSGRFWSAIQKLRREWSSLPSSQSGQPKRSWQDMQRMFLAYGGEIDPTDAGSGTVYV